MAARLIRSVSLKCFHIKALPPRKFFMLFSRLLIFVKINFFEKFFLEYHLSVKQIGSRSGPNILSGLTWVHTVCKGYQQKTLVGNELNMKISNLNTPFNPLYSEVFSHTDYIYRLLHRFFDPSPDLSPS